MKSQSRNRLLFLGLALTLVAAWFAPAKEKDGLALSERAKNVASKAQTKTDSMASKASVKTEPQVLTVNQRLREAADDSRPFNSTSWTPPVKPVIVVAQSQPSGTPTKVPTPLPEVAPPVPFRVLGRFEEEGESTVFLQLNDQNLAVKVGDTVAGKYKVESITSTNIGLLYVPLNKQQTLSMLEPQAAVASVRPRTTIPQVVPVPLPVPTAPGEPSNEPSMEPIPTPVAPVVRPRIMPLLPKPSAANQPQNLPADLAKTPPTYQPPSMPTGGPN